MPISNSRNRLGTAWTRPNVFVRIQDITTIRTLSVVVHFTSNELVRMRLSGPGMNVNGPSEWGAL
jgi:hypothetical protein